MINLTNIESGNPNPMPGWVPTHIHEYYDISGGHSRGLRDDKGVLSNIDKRTRWENGIYTIEEWDKLPGALVGGQKTSDFWYLLD
jgi:hypothetical protein